jgi:hypothetical protein
VQAGGAKSISGKDSTPPEDVFNWVDRKASRFIPIAGELFSAGRIEDWE